MLQPRQFQVKDVPIPEVGPDDILLKGAARCDHEDVLDERIAVQ